MLGAADGRFVVGTLNIQRACETVAFPDEIDPIRGHERSTLLRFAQRR
jgi:hypothetical protein